MVAKRKSRGKWSISGFVTMQSIFTSLVMASIMTFLLRFHETLYQRSSQHALPSTEKTAQFTSPERGALRGGGMKKVRPWEVPSKQGIKYELTHAFDTVDEKIFFDEQISASLPDVEEPIVYFVTPTYNRPTQMVDLVRLSQTLMLDGNIYWIVVEDGLNCTQRIRNLLDRTGLPYAHIAMPTPTQIKKMKNGHRGVSQRNRAIDIVLSLDRQGVLYFGDDDNGYDIRLFNELRKTKYVSVFGIAFAAGAAYERCVTSGDKIWFIASNWVGGRKFPMDMGGFAFNTKAIKEKSPKFSNDWPLGNLETKFVELLVDRITDLQPLNDKCRMILAWHVKTTSVGLNMVSMDKNEFQLIKNLI